MRALPYTRGTAQAGAAWLAALRLRYAALAAQPAAIVDRRALAGLAVKLAELTALLQQESIAERDALLLPRLAHCVASGLDILEGKCLPAPLTYPAPPQPAQGRGAALLQTVACYRALFGTLPTPLGRRRLEILLARFPSHAVLAALRLCAHHHGRAHWPAMEAALAAGLCAQRPWPAMDDRPA